MIKEDIEKIVRADKEINEFVAATEFKNIIDNQKSNKKKEDHNELNMNDINLSPIVDTLNSKKSNDDGFIFPESSGSENRKKDNKINKGNKNISYPSDEMILNDIQTPSESKKLTDGKLTLSNDSENQRMISTNNHNQNNHSGMNNNLNKQQNKNNNIINIQENNNKKNNIKNNNENPSNDKKGYRKKNWSRNFKNNDNK